jgi:hypothetical protein
MGYFDCITPAVIQRNILENPGWYTQYTPYQAEIAQGRLEALVNFQTMVADLTGLPLANASLLDEATAAAEAMTMCLAVSRSAGLERKEFFVSHDCHPQTVAVLQTRAEPLDITLHVGSTRSIRFDNPALSGLLLQYPTTDGYVGDYEALVQEAHRAGMLVVVATDLLALALLRPPGEFGADIACRWGSAVLMLPFCRPKKTISGRCPGALWECQRTEPGISRIGCRCRRASNISGAKKRRATSAPLKCCSRSSPVCTRSIMGLKDCGALHNTSMG